MSDLAARRQEEKDRRRESILEATAAVASSIGIDALTLGQVARKARLSRALIYVYFADKQDLVLGLADRANQLLYHRFIKASARRRNGLERIRSMGRAYVVFAEEEPVYFEALSRFAAHEPEKLQQHSNLQRCISGGDQLHGLLIAALEAGMTDGSIRRDIGPPALVAVSLWAFMHGVIQLIATKRELLALRGVTGKQLVDQAIALTTHSLQASV